jgi:E3 ubiquitin-protein ligase HECTD2
LQIPLCPGGEKLPVTNSNRREFVELYIHYLLDTAVSRQYEPFKRGFFTVCGGNALSLFRPEEIELLIRGSDEPLEIHSLRAVAIYEGWPSSGRAPDQEPQAQWFWAAFEGANPAHQRKLLAFITGSDRIPAMGATNLVIKIQLLDAVRRNGGVGPDTDRFPTARTCFNTLVLHPYRSRAQLEQKLWMAVAESEGFGLK